ncbi:MAG TPA: tetratricopeptide repeat protein [Drouetiella sp.]
MNVASDADGFENKTDTTNEQGETAKFAAEKKLSATAAHQGYTLIGVSFVVFELIFLVLYSNDFWFLNRSDFWGDLNVYGLGIPTVLIAILIAHLVLLWVESRYGCIFFAPIWKRRPPIVYRRWLRLNENELYPGLSFGQRHVIWEAIDEIELTFWGNLRIFSSALSGNPSVKTTKSFFPFFRSEGLEEVLKFPFSVGNLEDQKFLIEAMRHHNPQLRMNARLTKRLEQKDVKGTALVQQFGVVFLLVVLLDVGFSMFTFLEMLKNYYLCERTAIAAYREERKVAPIFFDQAESIRTHPIPVSWVSNKIMSSGKIASGVFQTRSDALWSMGRKAEAIESLKKAIELSPNTFRLNLRLARLLAQNDQRDEAINQLNEAIDNHASALLPRLYTLAITSDSQRARTYKSFLHDLDDELFASDLLWPPGTHLFLQDVFYRDDLTFIFDRLLNTDTSGIRGTKLNPKEKKHKAGS